jgi:hypothetical protein
MPTIQVEAQLSTDELLKAVDQLSASELERFTSQVLALRARRQVPSLPQAEAELLLKINRGLPFQFQRRYDELIAKRRAESLTLDEVDELVGLTDEVENLQARRIEYLSELARLRRTSLAGWQDKVRQSCFGLPGMQQSKYTKTQGYDPLTGELVPLYQPRQQRWRDHFVWNADFALIVGLTPTGRATVETLRLNREGLINLRRILYAMGEHPPAKVDENES